MANYFSMLGVAILHIVLIPVALGGVVVLVSRHIKITSFELGGQGALLVFGGLGVILHELSHLLVALLFGHKIEKVALLKRATPDNPTLGYVYHRWDSTNFYQRFGNVFIGVAPVIICPLVMLLTTRLLVPGTYAQLFHGTSSVNNHGAAATIIWFFLMVSIAIGGFDLSSADLANARFGLVSLALFLAIYALIGTWIFNTPAEMTEGLNELLTPFYASLLFALGVNVVLWVLSAVLRRVFR